MRLRNPRLRAVALLSFPFRIPLAPLRLDLMGFWWRVQHALNYFIAPLRDLLLA